MTPCCSKLLLSKVKYKKNRRIKIKNKIRQVRVEIKEEKNIKFSKIKKIRWYLFCARADLVFFAISASAIINLCHHLCHSNKKLFYVITAHAPKFASNIIKRHITKVSKLKNRHQVWKRSIKVKLRHRNVLLFEYWKNVRKIKFWHLAGIFFPSKPVCFDLFCTGISQSKHNTSVNTDVWDLVLCGYWLLKSHQTNSRHNLKTFLSWKWGRRNWKKLCTFKTGLLDFSFWKKMIRKCKWKWNKMDRSKNSGNVK